MMSERERDYEQIQTQLTRANNMLARQDQMILCQESRIAALDKEGLSTVDSRKLLLRIRDLHVKLVEHRDFVLALLSGPLLWALYCPSLAVAGQSINEYDARRDRIDRGLERDFNHVFGIKDDN